MSDTKNLQVDKNIDLINKYTEGKDQHFDDDFDETFSSSLGYIPSKDADKVMLEKDSKRDRTYFLTKVSLFFCLYFLTMILGMMVQIYLRGSTISFSVLKIWFYIWISAFINMVCFKIIFGLFGKYFRRFIIYFFFVDCFCIFLIIMAYDKVAIFTKENNYNLLVYLKPFVNLFCLIGILTSGSLTISTTINRGKGFNPLIGILLMTITIGITIFSIPYFENSNHYISHIKMDFIHLIIFYSIAYVFSIYIILDLWLISKKRKNKFFDNDYPLVFYSVGLDWTFRFWHYLFYKTDRGMESTIDNESKGEISMEENNEKELNL